MADTPVLPPKKDVALVLLEGPSMFVHLDPRRDEVAVPKWFKNQPQLVLQIGLNMVVPIPDLEVDEEGISCTLSFNRAPHWCHLPWTAVYALIGEDGRAMIWPEDVPPELALQLERAKLKAVPTKKPRKRGKAAAKQKAKPVEAPAPEPADPEADGAERTSKRPLPPYLRVIK
jgi:stringent starvation protein B